ncbi:hypothetical protein SMCB_1313 [Serpentinimonas maccroryi]|uniref:Uncharacterized protein n=1 Tax=Serpentinimonas maccroryi TaxID=1458426 RepID=A0A060NLV4_9BURK|nr:hypothetical protein SMCB_1313 [Serpentinimonas maccroryi]
MIAPVAVCPGGGVSTGGGGWAGYNSKVYPNPAHPGGPNDSKAAAAPIKIA